MNTYILLYNLTKKIIKTIDHVQSEKEHRHCYFSLKIQSTHTTQHTLRLTFKSLILIHIL